MGDGTRLNNQQSAISNEQSGMATAVAVETAEPVIGAMDDGPGVAEGDASQISDLKSPAPAPARGDRHWQACEIGMLIARAIDGRSYGAIGETLERTPRACERMLHRLLAGEHQCPEASKADLEDLRKKMLIAAKPWPTDATKSPFDATQGKRANDAGSSNRKSTLRLASLAQGKQSVEELRMIGRDLAEILKLLNVLVDLGVVSAGRYVAGNAGNLDLYGELAARDQRLFRRVAAMAAQIRARCEKPIRLAQDKPADHPFGKTGPIPHVVTGQGDYARAWPETPPAGGLVRHDSGEGSPCGWLRRMFCLNSQDCAGCLHAKPASLPPL